MRSRSSGCPFLTTARKRSRNSACTRTSGPISLSTPISRSARPSRKCSAVFSALGAKRICTSGAMAVIAVMSGAPKASTKPSFARMVKVRCNVAKSGSDAEGRSTPRASFTTSRVRSRSASACGVSTMLRPARTSSGSPVASRRRVSVRLMADALNPSRRAAPITLPSASNTSSATSRFRSGSAMRAPGSVGRYIAFGAFYKCTRRVFRHVCGAHIVLETSLISAILFSLSGNDSCKTRRQRRHKRRFFSSAHRAGWVSRWRRNTSGAAGM
ncbi:protein of unknown function [Paraburkholderia kururiensis]